MSGPEKKLQRLDVRGYLCPYPQLMTMKALEKLSPGEMVEVVLDSPPSYKIIQDMAKQRGHEVVSAEKIQDNVWRIVIKKRG